MPLKSGKSNIGYNIKELMSAKHPREQAIAIALDYLRRKKKK